MAHHALKTRTAFNRAFTTELRNIIIIGSRPNHKMFVLFNFSQKAPEFRSICPCVLCHFYQFTPRASARIPA